MWDTTVAHFSLAMRVDSLEMPFFAVPERYGAFISRATSFSGRGSKLPPESLSIPRRAELCARVRRRRTP